MSGAPTAPPAATPGPTRPPASQRGLLALGAAGLSIEALVVLLATPAVVSLDRGHQSGVKIGVLLALFVLLVVAAAVVRRPFGKAFGSAVQPLVFLGGLVTWPMFVIGAVFGLIWVYWLRLWRLLPPDAAPDSAERQDGSD